ncbi:MAG: NPCBM/NEW2 domain-containing protein [Phycisphaerales bacterium]|nr:NPCBM/NEW2 domain-containing protein [Phycisphaerales bacterium]
MGPRSRKATIVRFAARTVALLAITAGQAQVRVAVQTIDGDGFEGAVIAVAPDLVIHDDVADRPLSWESVSSIRVVTAPDSGASIFSGSQRGLVFELADGSLFRGEIVGVDGDRMTIRASDGQIAYCTRAELRAVYGESAEADIVNRVYEARRTGETNEDIAIVSRGAKSLTLRGRVQDLTDEGVRFQWNNRETTLPWGRISALAIAEPPTRTASARVTLRDGTIIAGRVVSGDDRSVKVRSAVFDGYIADWDAITRIECASDRVRYLSDMRPAMYRFEPFFSRQWEFGVDRTLDHGPLRVGGVSFDKAVVLHSRALSQFDLSGAFDRFTASVGILDGHPQGSAHVMISVDGVARWENEHVVAGAAPIDVSFPVAHGRTLELFVDFGDALDIGDHVCFGDARLLRDR